MISNWMWEWMGEKVIGLSFCTIEFVSLIIVSNSFTYVHTHVSINTCVYDEFVKERTLKSHCGCFESIRKMWIFILSFDGQWLVFKLQSNSSNYRMERVHSGFWLFSIAAVVTAAVIHFSISAYFIPLPAIHVWLWSSLWLLSNSNEIIKLKYCLSQIV